MATVLVLLSACERPFVEVTPPGITVKEPDLSLVRTDPELVVSVQAASFRPITSVVVNGQAMTFEPELNQWTDTLRLARGLNELVVTATDVGETTSQDTFYAVHTPFRFIQRGPMLPEPRGGHTATYLESGAILVAGGAPSRTAPAANDAFVMLPGAGTFQRINARLKEARTGHTATRLPDGRILFVGGSRTENLGAVDDLVETVEIYNPEAGMFEVFPFRGQPIRRAYHTAILRQAGTSLVLDLYGGRGDIRYEPDPRLGTRDDLRSFQVTADSLIALNSLASAPFLDAPIWGHTQSLLPRRSGTYLIVGSFFDAATTDDVSFTVEYNEQLGLLLEEAPTPSTSRTRHADALLSGEFIVLFGGRQLGPSSGLSMTELYSSEADQFFRLPQPEQSVKRFGHSATNLSAQRILLLGGFATDGTAFDNGELFDTTFFN